MAALAAPEREELVVEIARMLTGKIWNIAVVPAPVKSVAGRAGQDQPGRSNSLSTRRERNEEGAHQKDCRGRKVHLRFNPTVCRHDFASRLTSRPPDLRDHCLARVEHLSLHDVQEQDLLVRRQVGRVDTCLCSGTFCLFCHGIGRTAEGGMERLCRVAERRSM